MEATHASNVLSPRRLGLLLRRDVAYGYRSTLIAAASAAGVAVLIAVLTAIGGVRASEPLYVTLFSIVLYVGGFVYTSMVFRELHRGGATLFLTLPSSSLEKFASKAVVTSVGFAAAALAFMTATSALAELVCTLAFGSRRGVFNPFDREILNMVAVYLVAQAIFLAGSVYFRKLALLKTLGLVSAFGFAASLLWGLLAWLLMRDHFIVEWAGSSRSIRPDAALESLFADLSTGRVALPAVLETVRRVGEVLYWALLAPACWVIAYLKMREKEV